MSERRSRLDRALGPGTRRPAGPRPLADTLVFAWRAILKIRHNPEQAFDVVVTPVMFTVMFTYLFGGALVGSTEAYLQFLLPGILVQTVMFTSIYTGFTLNQDIKRGVFDRFSRHADLATGGRSRVRFWAMCYAIPPRRCSSSASVS